ncbi:MAG: hypothetical protein CL938_03170 [Deltaproteobacteria bacterium]|nr:hypothetical protein [Deltaproteobacteria bacterium]
MRVGSLPAFVGEGTTALQGPFDQVDTIDGGVFRTRRGDGYRSLEAPMFRIWRHSARRAPCDGTGMRPGYCLSPNRGIFSEVASKPALGEYCRLESSLRKENLHGQMSR